MMHRMNKILCVGSVAFDVLFQVTNSFQEALPLQGGQLSDINASYLAAGKSEVFGGTGGNIAAWCGEEGIASTLFTAWGKDFSQKGYQAKLERLGVSVVGSEGDYSATAYMISDPAHQQMIIWQPNHYEVIESLDLTDHVPDLTSFEIAIFSPGTPDSILKHMTQFRTANPEALLIFDPGQVSPYFTAQNFKTCLEMADILIGNQVEWTHFHRYTDSDFGSDCTLIQTQGAEGVRLTHRGEVKIFPAIKVETVQETTGAGDAFRAGLISVLVSGGDLISGVEKGLQLGAECVGLMSPQK